MDKMSFMKYALAKYNSSNEPESCKHSETDFENGHKICVDCGVVVDAHFLVDTVNLVTKQRVKRVDCTIYSEIPPYVPQDVKSLAVEIYKTVTSKRIFRNVFRKAIILACLHRASIIKENPIFFDDMLEIFNLKTHDANRGITFVSTNLPKNSPYDIPFCTDEICVSSVLSLVGLKSAKYNVCKIFELVKEKSNVLNNSHCKSIVCGCIYFHVRYRSVPLTLRQVAQKCGMAEATILKKYMLVCEIVMKSCMKSIFSSLLSTALPENPKQLCYASKSLNALVDPIERLTIFDYATKDSIKIVAEDDGFEYPLDDVDCLYDWNVLLQKTYYDHSGQKYELDISITETPREIVVDFSNYNERNRASGEYVLRREIDAALDYENCTDIVIKPQAQVVTTRRKV